MGIGDYRAQLLEPVMNIQDLNPGIRQLVYFLNNRGFQTVDSGDGKTHLYECDQAQPYVVMKCEPDRIVDSCNLLAKILRSDCGIQLDGMNEDNSVPTIEAHYSPLSGVATITLWNVTDETGDFSRP